MEDEKAAVHNFWNEESCGESLYLHQASTEGYQAQARERYRLEPYIENFAQFAQASGQRVLEIGVGLGADHQRFAEAGAQLSGIDLTSRAVEHTRKRLKCFGLPADVSVGDAEHLAFPDGEFDVVYSWGVIHHSPNTQRAVREIHRVLKAGGQARVMIYHTWSMVGLMLWARYAALGLKPWLSLADIYSRYLESPGTKAYTLKEARQLFSEFSDVKIEIVLTHGDLLDSDAGQRHRGVLLSVAKHLWPRNVIRRLLPKAGLFMLIQARK